MKLATTLLLVSLAAASMLPVLAAEPEVPLVKIDDKALEGAAPLSQEGRLLVPLRGIFEKLGAQVNYDSAQKLIVATRGKQTISLKIGEKQARVGDRTVDLDIPAQLQDGSTYVPLRFVAEALGAKVSWDPSVHTVSILSPVERLLPDEFTADVDLKRLMIGSQAGIVKVFDRDRSGVAFFRGIDDRSVAPLDDAARSGIFGSLKVDVSRLSQTAIQIMGDFPSLPHKEAVALLGVFGSTPTLDAETQSRLQIFLCAVVSGDPDVVTRRQGLLALAVMRTPSAQTVEEVVRLFEHSENLWETFPVQQFFEYHAAQIRMQPGYPEIRERLSRVASLYTPNVLSYLDAAPSDRRVPIRN